MKILLIEDDFSTSLAISEALKMEKYQVDRADNGQMGLELAESIDYDLILLDIILPKLNGLEVCRHLRNHYNYTPILLLTAKNSPQDCVTGLEAGADDYLVKPFAWSELLARIKALLRREKTVICDVLTWEHLQINLNTHEVTYKGSLLNLTPIEYGLLALLLRKPQRIFSRQTILDRLWPTDKSPGEETVTAHVKKLRRKLKKAGMNKEMIKTVYGFGYRLAEPNEESLTPFEQQLQEKISEIWEQKKERLEKDREILVQLIINLPSQGSQKSAKTEEAIALAHRLGGTLGIFGKQQASQILEQMEQLLQNQADSQQWTKLLDLAIALEQTWNLDAQTIHCGAINRAEGLLCIGVEQQWLQVLKTVSFLEHCPIEAVSTLKDAQSILGSHQPKAVIIDLELTETRDKGVTFLRELGQKNPNLPFFVLDSRHDLSYRLDIAHAGQGMFLHKPLTSDRLLRAVIKKLQPHPTPEATLMLVDDDSLFLGALTPILTASGFKVICLSEPEKFWQVLEENHPDVLILDMEMPQFNGLDLCKIVRKDDRFCSVPIIFVSRHQNFKMIDQGFASGANDYVRKPLVPEELIARIFKQLNNK